MMKVEHFPLCVLHNTRIVDDFPRGCPLGQLNPSAALMAYRDRGWKRMGEFQSGGGADIERVEICTDCMRRLCGNTHVTHLRRLEVARV